MILHNSIKNNCVIIFMKKCSDLLTLSFARITYFLATLKNKVKKNSHLYLFVINEFYYVSFRIKWKWNLKNNPCTKRFLQLMWQNPQFTFAEEILNGKLYFLWSECSFWRKFNPFISKGWLYALHFLIFQSGLCE